MVSGRLLHLILKDHRMKSPIFLFSMPRAGSTLLQRILLSHESIGGTSEPWILLPIVYSIRQKGSLSEYSSKLSHKAITEFLSKTPDGQEFYYNELKNFTSKIYSKFLKDKEEYFLDKTPRYYFIIDEIYKIYPDAKFIYLFRNPVNVYASILTTWCNNNFFEIYGCHNDLVYGFNKLSQAYLKYKDENNTYKIMYEDLVSSPTKTIKDLQDFLQIDYDESIQHNFINSNIDFKKEDTLGDPTGIHQYNVISTETLAKWESVFNTRIRKRILRKYISKVLNEKDLNIQGYNKKQILEEIKQLNTKGRFSFLKDLMSYSAYRIVIKLNLYMYFAKDMSWTKKKFIS